MQEREAIHSQVLRREISELQAARQAHSTGGSGHVGSHRRPAVGQPGAEPEPGPGSFLNQPVLLCTLGRGAGSGTRQRKRRGFPLQRPTHAPTTPRCWQDAESLNWWSGRRTRSASHPHPPPLHSVLPSPGQSRFPLLFQPHVDGRSRSG